ncbi:MAG: CpaF family protein [Micromonosporaceae bacterium]|nr:CpaF family protein [Micromonosporaceae bacterium]
MDQGLVRRLQAQVAEQLTERQSDPAGRLSVADQRLFARNLIAEAIDGDTQARLRNGQPLRTEAEEDALARAVFDRLFGLGRLQRLLDDPTISDIEINGHDRVFVAYRDGHKLPVDPVADSDAELVGLVRLAAARMGRTERRFDAAQPELRLQLPDGSRLHAVMEVSGRPCVSIRRHDFELSFLPQLTERGMIDRPLEAFLRAAVLARRNIVVSGAIGAGKTTLLRALINEIPAEERLITIEDNLELDIDRFPDLHPNVVTLEAREANIEGHGAVTLESLVRMSLRMNPDRVFVGEVSGPEMLPMLLAMTQGRDGSMCTIHAHSARGVAARFEQFGLLLPQQLSAEATARLVANAVDFVVHIGGDRTASGRHERHRTVEAVLEIVDADGQQLIANEVFTPDGQGVARPARGLPLRPSSLAQLTAAGLDPGWLGARR